MQTSIPVLIRSPCPSPISKSSTRNSDERSSTAFGKAALLLVRGLRLWWLVRMLAPGRLAVGRKL